MAGIENRSQLVVPKERRLQVAVIGAGSAGTRHADALSRLSDANVSFYDRDLSQSERAIASITKKQRDAGLSEPLLFSAGDPDEAIRGAHLVIVATPDDQHTEYIKQATHLRVPGLDVPPLIFAEKPFTTSLDEAYECFDAAQGNRANVVSGSLYSLTPVFRYVQKQVGGENIRRIETDYRHDMRPYHDPSNWRSEQDFWYGGGSHAVVSQLDIMGDDRIVEVSGFRGRADREGRDIRFHENATVIFQYESGAQGVVTLDGRSVPPGGKHGTSLMVACEGVTYQTHNKDESVVVSREGEGGVETVSHHVGTAMTVDLLATTLTEYLRGERADYAPMHDLRRTMELMHVLDAGEKALQLSGRVPTDVFHV